MPPYGKLESTQESLSHFIAHSNNDSPNVEFNHFGALEAINSVLNLNLNFWV